MNSGVIDIPWPLLFLFFSTLERDIVISIVRMTIQLLMVGLYLEYLFNTNNAVINTVWLLVMTLIGASAIISKANLPHKIDLPCVSEFAYRPSTNPSSIMLSHYKASAPLRAQYIIPLAGMLLE